MLFNSLNLKTKVFLIIQSVCMLMGASRHIVWVFNNGFLSEKYNASFFSALFWDSLTFLDPIAAFLLILKPKKGLYLVLAIMLLDIIHNNIFYLEELYFSSISITDWIKKYWMIGMQMIFGVFVISTFKSNLTNVKKAEMLK